MQPVPLVQGANAHPEHLSLSPSRLSYLSSNTSSSYTNTFDLGASSSTIWGPGALTGKGIKAFGEAALRGVEALVIRRRLAVIEARFPHDASVTINGIDQMYDDLLELSRPDLYDAKIRQRALRLIINQVDLGETRHLLQSLTKWPPVEINLFVSQFMSMPFSNGSPDSIAWVLLDGKGVVTYRFLVFACRLASLTASTCQLLLDMRLLDMIFQLCIRKNERWMTYTSDDVLAFCNSTLRSIYISYPGCQHTISNHPISALWPSYATFFLRAHPPPMLSSPGPSLDRQSAWRKVESRYIQRRLWVLCWQLDVTESSKVEDACVDLLELSTGDLYEPQVKELAGELFRKFMVRNYDFNRAYEACCEAIGVDPGFLQSERWNYGGIQRIPANSAGFGGIS